MLSVFRRSAGGGLRPFKAAVGPLRRNLAQAAGAQQDGEKSKAYQARFHLDEYKVRKIFESDFRSRGTNDFVGAYTRFEEIPRTVRTVSPQDLQLLSL